MQKVTDKIKFLPIYKDNTCICYCTSNFFAKYCIASVLSLIKNSSELKTYDIIVFETDFLSNDNRDLFNTIVKNKHNVSLRFIDASKYLNIDLYERGVVTKATYCRFCIFDVLDVYKNVIYIDCDTIVNTDISLLYKIDFGNKLIAAVTDYNLLFNCYNNTNWMKAETNYIFNELKLNSIHDYFNGGVLVFNIQKIKDKTNLTTKKLFNMAISKKWRTFDQDILNIVFKNNVLYLDEKWNVPMFIHNFDVIDINKLKNMPKENFEKYCVAFKNPFILHFLDRTMPTYFPNHYYASLYHNYINDCPSLCEIFQKERDKIYRDEKIKLKEEIKFKNRLKRYFTNIVFPFGSKRGKLLRKLIRK